MVRALMVFCLLSLPAIASPGEVDAMGCHRDMQVKDYHCHRGPLAGQSFKNKDEAVKALNAVNAKGPAKAAPVATQTQRPQ